MGGQKVQTQQGNALADGQQPRQKLQTVKHVHHHFHYRTEDMAKPDGKMPSVPLKALDVKGTWNGKKLGFWNGNWQHVAENQHARPGQIVEHKEIHSYAWKANPAVQQNEKVMSYVKGSQNDPTINRNKLSDTVQKVGSAIRPLKPFYGKIE